MIPNRCVRCGQPHTRHEPRGLCDTMVCRACYKIEAKALTRSPALTEAERNEVRKVLVLSVVCEGLWQATPPPGMTPYFQLLYAC